MAKKKTTAAAPAAVVKNETLQPAVDAVVLVSGESAPLADEAKPTDVSTSEAAPAATAADASVDGVGEAKSADPDLSAPDAPAADGAALGGSDELSVTDVEFVEVVPSVYPRHVRFFNNSSSQIADTKTGVFLGPAGTHDMTFGDAEHEQSILESLEVTIAEAYVPRELVTVQTLHKTNEV